MRSTLAGGLIAVALAGAACHKMTMLTWTELQTFRPTTAWVTHTDESIVQVSGPQVFGDTLVGYVNGEFLEIPTATVKHVTIREPARGKTVALVVASTAAAVGIAAFMAGSGLFGSSVDCYDQPEHPDCINGT